MKYKSWTIGIIFILIENLTKGRQVWKFKEILIIVCYENCNISVIFCWKFYKFLLIRQELFKKNMKYKSWTIEMILILIENLTKVRQVWKFKKILIIVCYENCNVSVLFCWNFYKFLLIRQELFKKRMKYKSWTIEIILVLIGNLTKSRQVWKFKEI